MSVSASFTCLFYSLAVAADGLGVVSDGQAPRQFRADHHVRRHLHKSRTGLPSDYSKYHTGEDIIRLIQEAKSSCAVPLEADWQQDKEEATDQNARVFVVRAGNTSAPKKVMIAANEHAREMLTAEVALRFIQNVCDKQKNSHAELFEQVSYVILPIVNMKGRALVESGENECQRMTIESEGDVDINRNMDVDWGKGQDIQKWGNNPFSTFQARILRDVAQSTKPLAYIDLHTGARTLMTSWGLKPHVDPDFKDQEKSLTMIQSQFCPDCKIGSNRLVIGYENPGEVIDHMYAKERIKYSSLWELYEGPSRTCIGLFNPDDNEFESVVSNWADALVSYGFYVKDEVKLDERSHVKVGDYSLLQERSREREFTIDADAEMTEVVGVDEKHLST